MNTREKYSEFSENYKEKLKYDNNNYFNTIKSSYSKKNKFFENFCEEEDEDEKEEEEVLGNLKKFCSLRKNKSYLKIITLIKNDK